MNRKILIVDDCDSISEVLKDVMALAGIEGIICPTCSDALQKLQEETYSAAIIDICLPDGHGLQVLKAVKEKNPFAMVYVLTGKPTLEDLSVFMEQGADDFFNKGTLDIKNITETVKAGFSKQAKWNDTFNNFEGTHF